MLLIVFGEKWRIWLVRENSAGPMIGPAAAAGVTKATPAGRKALISVTRAATTLVIACICAEQGGEENGAICCRPKTRNLATVPTAKLKIASPPVFGGGCELEVG